jgi:hypothetical protein
MEVRIKVLCSKRHPTSCALDGIRPALYGMLSPIRCEGLMLNSPISRLPVGSRVAIQSADRDAFTYLCWHSFHMASGEVRG